MAFLGIGKKTPKAPPAGAAGGPSGLGDAADSDGGESTAPKAKPAKKGFFGSKSDAKGKAAPSKLAASKAAGAKPARAKSAGSGGELDIYTAVLLAAVIALAAGCVLVALDNLAGVEGGSDEGNPFVVLSSR